MAMILSPLTVVVSLIHYSRYLANPVHAYCPPFLPLVAVTSGNKRHRRGIKLNGISPALGTCGSKVGCRVLQVHSYNDLSLGYFDGFASNSIERVLGDFTNLRR